MSDGWIDWHGGECPVSGILMVDVRYRDGQAYRFLNGTKHVRWTHDYSESDIVAYRVAEGTSHIERALQATEPESPVESLLETANDHGFHVVESGDESSKLPPLAIDLLDWAKNIQVERAKEYEQAGGERSVAKLVTAFNAITGRDLRESEGWLFLQILKMVRSEASGVHADSILDNVSYASLYGEARSAGR